LRGATSWPLMIRVLCLPSPGDLMRGDARGKVLAQMAKSE